MTTTTTEKHYKDLQKKMGWEFYPELLICSLARFSAFTFQNLHIARVAWKALPNTLIEQSVSVQLCVVVQKTET